MTHVAVYMGTKNGVDIVNQHSSYHDQHDYHDDWQTDAPHSWRSDWLFLFMSTTQESHGGE